MEFLLGDSIYEDCEELSKTLRPQDRLEAERLGLNPESAVFSSFASSSIRKTAFVDGKVAAMFGVTGEIGGKGKPWFITGTVSDTVSPLAFTRLYLYGFNKIKDKFTSLENYVDFEYSGAIRLLKIAGFKIHKPVCLGPEEALFCRFTYSPDV